MDTAEAGRKGGQSRSLAKQVTARQNAVKARDARAAKRAAQSEPPQPDPKPQPRFFFLRNPREDK